MSIPDEAVEAAARAELAQLIRDESNTYDGRYVVNPDSLADEIMLAGWAKKLMAEAWEEGKNVRRCDGVPPNPYRLGEGAL